MSSNILLVDFFGYLKSLTKAINDDDDDGII